MQDGAFLGCKSGEPHDSVHEINGVVMVAADSRTSKAVFHVPCEVLDRRLAVLGFVKALDTEIIESL